MAVDIQKAIRSRGDWTARPQPRYSQGDVVLHSNRLWILTGAAAGSDAPDVNTNWELFALHDYLFMDLHKGDWQAGREYRRGDIVYHPASGSTYICEVGTQEEPPEGPWKLLADRGQEGEPGQPGNDGKSAYELAVADGFAGTEAEWLASLKGADGQDGTDGAQGVPGPPGQQGPPGAAGKDGNLSAGWRGEWAAAQASADPYLKNAVVTYEGRVLLATKNALTDGTRPHEDDAWVTLLPADVPAGSLSVLSRRAAKAVFQWAPVADWGTHRLQRSTGTGWENIDPKEDDEPNQVTVEDAQDGVAYRLSVTNVYGDHSSSDAFVLTSEDEGGVYTPQNLQVSNVKVITATLSWEHPESSGVTFSVENNAVELISDLPSNARSTQLVIPQNTVEDLVYYTVTAHSRDGDKALHSFPIPVTFRSPAPPVITASFVSKNLVRVTWSTDDDVDGFILERRKDNNPWEEMKAFDPNLYADRDVAPGSEYRYRVRSQAGGARLSPWSSEAVVPEWGNVPVPVLSGELDLVKHTISLSWSYTDSTSQYPLKRFFLEEKRDGGGWTNVASVSGASEPRFSFTSEEVPVGAVRKYRLRAETKEGDLSEWSPVSGFERQPYRSKGSGLRIKRCYPGSIMDLAWDAAPGADSYLLVVGNGNNPFNKSVVVKGLSYSDVRVPSGGEWMTITPIRGGERGERSNIVRLSDSPVSSFPVVRAALPWKGKTEIKVDRAVGNSFLLEKSPAGSSSWSRVDAIGSWYAHDWFSAAGDSKGDRYRFGIDVGGGRFDFSNPITVGDAPDFGLWEMYGYLKGEGRTVTMQTKNIPAGFGIKVKYAVGGPELIDHDAKEIGADGKFSFTYTTRSEFTGGHFIFYIAELTRVQSDSREVRSASPPGKVYIEKETPTTVQKGKGFHVYARSIAKSGESIVLDIRKNPSNTNQGWQWRMGYTTGYLDLKKVFISLSEPGDFYMRVSVVHGSWPNSGWRKITVT